LVFAEKKFKCHEAFNEMGIFATREHNLATVINKTTQKEQRELFTDSFFF
jgi:hypothetical protein